MSETEIVNKETYWFKYITEWETSQLNQKVFCAQNNLSFIQFGYWRKKYYKAKAIPETIKTSERWISLTPAVTSSTALLTISIPHRCTLTVPVNIAPAQLEIILTLLGLKYVCTS